MPPRLLRPLLTLASASASASASPLRPRGAGSVLLSVSGRQAQLTLSNPAARNALSPRMMVDLAQHVAELERRGEEVSVVVVRGEGGTFCAGFDLSQGLDTKEEGVGMCQHMHDVTRRLHGLGAVVVAFIEGAAMGGGAELTTACDHRVMAPSAKIRFVHATLNISPGWGGASRLARIVGRSTALRLIATGPTLTASEAKEVGLVDHVSESVEAFVAPYLVPHPSSIHSIKRGVDSVTSIPPEAYAQERDAFANVWASPAMVDARQKLMAKLRKEHSTPGN